MSKSRHRKKDIKVCSSKQEQISNFSKCKSGRGSGSQDMIISEPDLHMLKICSSVCRAINRDPYSLKSRRFDSVKRIAFKLILKRLISDSSSCGELYFLIVNKSCT